MSSAFQFVVLVRFKSRQLWGVPAFSEFEAMKIRRVRYTRFVFLTDHPSMKILIYVYINMCVSMLVVVTTERHGACHWVFLRC